MIHDAGAAAIVFWLCAAGVAYHYLGYPVIVALLSRTFGRERPFPARDPLPLPTVSILVAALNEDTVIAARIANALTIDYPADRYEIVIASDGSTDRTCDIVRSFSDPRVRLIAFPSTRGKAPVLNDVVPALTSDIVVFSDANSMLNRGAVRRLVRWLAAPDVGVAVGRLVLTSAADTRNTDGLYWRYETFLKRCEVRLGALLGANGAIYAIRQRLFVPLPTDTLIDDFVLPLLIKLRTRCTLVYDAESIAYEEMPARIRSEMRRRSRIGAGALASLRVLWPLLSPANGWIAFAFMSHKLLRWVSPFLLAGLFVSGAFLHSPFFRYTFDLQAAFYAAAIAGLLIPGSTPMLKPLRLAALFASVNAALVVGWWQWVSGRRETTWAPTARTGAGAAAPSPETASRDLTIGV